ncbi:MAG: lamin tail domain-containing protein [Candidatus Moduliflexus flocculans]|nr:lamin tail domain-containing protein [Candidatus Moduliflexus flocculans]
MRTRNPFARSLFLTLPARLSVDRAGWDRARPGQRRADDADGDKYRHQSGLWRRGNAGAPYLNDYVELFNPSNTPIPVNGWSIQYTSPTGTGLFSSNVVNLSGSLSPGQYYLIRLASGGSNGAALPPSDATGTIDMGATNGKIALVNTTIGLSCNGGSTPCTPSDLASIIDLVGYGSASFFEEVVPLQQ